MGKGSISKLIEALDTKATPDAVPTAYEALAAACACESVTKQGIAAAKSMLVALDKAGAEEPDVADASHAMVKLGWKYAKGTVTASAIGGEGEAAIVCVLLSYDSHADAAAMCKKLLELAEKE